MEKERIENVLRTNISDEDMKTIRVYYLKFYNDPEKYVGTDFISLILADIDKSQDPNWQNKTASAELVQFKECDELDKRYEVPWHWYEDYTEGDHSMSDRVNFAMKLMQQCVGDFIEDVDIDQLLTAVKTIASKHSWHWVENSQLTDIKRQWVKIVDNYGGIGKDKDSRYTVQAFLKLRRLTATPGATSVEVMAKMVVAYDMYCKFIDMTFRCSRDTSLNTNIISEYMHNEVGNGMIEIDEMVEEMHKAVQHAQGRTAKDWQDACQKVFMKYVTAANIDYACDIMSGKYRTIEEAQQDTLTQAAHRAEELLKERTLYIEDISTALNQMKILIELIRSWSDWDYAPWMRKTEFGYANKLDSQIDVDVCWNSAVEKLTMWGVFAEWVYGMNDAIHYHITHDRTSIWSDQLGICESLYEDLVNVGDEWLKTAVHKQHSTVSSLLQMAAGK